MGFARTVAICSRYSRHSAGRVELCPCSEGGARRSKVITAPLKSTKVQPDNSKSARPPAELVNSSARVPTKAGGFHHDVPSKGSDLRQRGVGGTSWRSEGKRQRETVNRYVLAGEPEGNYIIRILQGSGVVSKLADFCNTASVRSRQYVLVRGSSEGWCRRSEATRASDLQQRVVQRTSRRPGRRASKKKAPTRHILAGELAAYSKVPVPGHPGWPEPVSGAGRRLLNKPP